MNGVGSSLQFFLVARTQLKKDFKMCNACLEMRLCNTKQAISRKCLEMALFDVGPNMVIIM